MTDYPAAAFAPGQTIARTFSRANGGPGVFIHTIVPRGVPGYLTAFNRSLVPVPKTVLSSHRNFTSAFKRFKEDWVITTPTKAVSGTLFDVTNVIVANATVKLVRQMDDAVIAVGITDSAGHYFFLRDAADPYAYYVIAFTAATSPQVHGVSDRGIVPS